MRRADVGKPYVPSQPKKGDVRVEMTVKAARESGSLQQTTGGAGQRGGGGMPGVSGVVAGADSSRSSAAAASNSAAVAANNNSNGNKARDVNLPPPPPPKPPNRQLVTVDSSRARSNIDVLRLCLQDLGWREVGHNHNASVLSACHISYEQIKNSSFTRFIQFHIRVHVDLNSSAEGRFALIKKFIIIIIITTINHYPLMLEICVTLAISLSSSSLYSIIHCQW